MVSGFGASLTVLNVRYPEALTRPSVTTTTLPLAPMLAPPQRSTLHAGALREGGLGHGRHARSAVDADGFRGAIGQPERAVGPTISSSSPTRMRPSR
jgi:hypothetical protein